MKILLRGAERFRGTGFSRQKYFRERLLRPNCGSPFVSGARISGCFRRFFFPVSQMLPVF